MLQVNFSDAIPKEDQPRIQQYYEKKLLPFFADHPDAELTVSHDGTQWNIESNKDLSIIMAYFQRH